MSQKCPSKQAPNLGSSLVFDDFLLSPRGRRHGRNDDQGWPTVTISCKYVENMRLRDCPRGGRASNIGKRRGNRGWKGLDDVTFDLDCRGGPGRRLRTAAQT